MAQTTLPDVLKHFFDAQIAQIHTAMPCEVISYDHKIQKAIVRPLLNRKYKDGKIGVMPPIVSVPVIWPRSGGASMTFPVKEGDGMLLVFSERSLEEFLSYGGQVTPSDPRRFDLTDGMAIPGLNSFSLPSLSENNEDVRLTYGSSNVRLKPNECHVKFEEATFKADKNSIQITFGGGKCEILSNGKIALTSNGVDVLAVLSQALGTLSSEQVFTGDAGMQPLVNAGTYGSLQGQIDSIRGG